MAAPRRHAGGASAVRTVHDRSPLGSSFVTPRAPLFPENPRPGQGALSNTRETVLRRFRRVRPGHCRGAWLRRRHGTARPPSEGSAPQRGSPIPARGSAPKATSPRRAAQLRHPDVNHGWARPFREWRVCGWNPPRTSRHPTIDRSAEVHGCRRCLRPARSGTPGTFRLRSLRFRFDSRCPASLRSMLVPSCCVLACWTGDQANTKAQDPDGNTGPPPVAAGRATPPGGVVPRAASHHAAAVILGHDSVLVPPTADPRRRSPCSVP